MARTLGPEEKVVLETLSETYPRRLGLGDLARHTSLEGDVKKLLRAVEDLKTRGFVDCKLLRDSDGLDDAHDILISQRGLEFATRPEVLDSRAGLAASSTPETRVGRKKLRTAVVLNVLIASPSDVEAERECVETAIHSWNAAHYANTGIMLNAVRWETHAFPASGDRPQAIVNKQIVVEGDLLIGIFGCRIGTPTGQAESGTIEEIELFRNAGKHVALYFSTADVPRDADRQQLDALNRYREQRRHDTLYFTFARLNDLGDLVTQHLPRIVYEVHSSLRASGGLGKLAEEVQSIEDNSEKRLAQLADRGDLLLADIVSELEDNLACAANPRVGDTYRRPSTERWHAHRNEIALPAALRAEVSNINHQIDRWQDVVNSGLSPNIGSTELERIISVLRGKLPEVIRSLRAIPSGKSSNLSNSRNLASEAIEAQKSASAALKMLADLETQKRESEEFSRFKPRIRVLGDIGSQFIRLEAPELFEVNYLEYVTGLGAKVGSETERRSGSVIEIPISQRLLVEVNNIGPWTDLNRSSAQISFRMGIGKLGHFKEITHTGQLIPEFRTISGQTTAVLRVIG